MSTKKPPFDPDKLYQRAILLHQQGKLAEAESLYRTLLGFFPNQVEVLTPLGTVLLQQGRAGEGIQHLTKSLQLVPRQPEAHYSLGVEYQNQVWLEEALACYERAAALNPRDLNVWINRGNTLKDLQRYKEALASYAQAIAIKPDYAPAYWNKALLHLLLGEYETGWQLYEWGWRCGERGRVRTFDQPKWLGESSIAGKTVLIHAEQGLGDVIQFCRYALLAEAQGANVILEVQPALVSLLESLGGNIRVVAKGSELPPFDYYCPVMSLPLAFKSTVDNIPTHAPYLHVKPEKSAAWAERLGQKTKPRVGIVWSGSQTNKIDLNPCSRRNIALQQLKPLFELPLEFHSLQKEYRPEDAALLSELPIRAHQDDLQDFSDTAALIREMDVVISVCTSVAHLAGALGHLAWVLLPYSPDYRWMLDRADSPWYPTVHLIRQVEIGNWTSVISQVVQRLKKDF